MPKIDKHSQYLLRTFSKSVSSDVQVATYKTVKPSIAFYAKRKIRKIELLEELQEELNKENKFAFITKKKLIEGIMLDNALKLKEDDRYVIYKNY